MWGQYQLFDIEAEQQQYGRPGSSYAAIANRVSYHFDFNGPSMALDTMCS
jgi:acyl transferase domain-containing protein